MTNQRIAALQPWEPRLTVPAGALRKSCEAAYRADPPGGVTGTTPPSPLVLFDGGGSTGLGSTLKPSHRTRRLRPSPPSTAPRPCARRRRASSRRALTHAKSHKPQSVKSRTRDASAQLRARVRAALLRRSA
jgi:hypothetical protein